MNPYEPNPLAPFDMPMTIEVIEGEVVFIGPGPIAFSMTLQAARETAQRLAEVLAEVLAGRSPGPAGAST